MVKNKRKQVIHVVYAEYPAQEWCTTRDRQLEKAVGKASGGSGLGFGKRDISWDFSKPDAANAGVWLV